MSAFSYSPTIPLDTVDVDYLKSAYLTGFTFLDADGQELPEIFFQEHLVNAMAVLEEQTNVSILLTEVVGEKHDYRANDYAQFAFLQLFKIPTASVSEVRAVYPTGQTIQVFPSEWVRLERTHSILQLVPTSGSLSQVILGYGSDYLPLIFNGIGMLPQLWEVDYTCGFPPDAVPRIIVEALCKLAAVEILKIVSDLVHPLGVTSASLSVDGLSQSKGFNLPAFKARIDAYEGDLHGDDGLIKQISQNYRGIMLASV